MARYIFAPPPRAARLAVLGLLVAGTAQAQPPGSAAPESKGIGGIVGVVADSAGTGIAGAQLTVVGIVGRGASDASGAFRLIGVSFFICSNAANPSCNSSLSGTSRTCLRPVSLTVAHPQKITITKPADTPRTHFIIFICRK